VDLASVSASFSPLRRNLIIGVSAAFALLGMVIAIGLRFPHYLRGKQLEGQMELARAVQGNLLPTSAARFRSAEIAADCTPASQIGGDFYDVFDLPGRELGVMLGDVSGKGVSAAPLMGFIHGAAHASSWTDSPRDHEQASGRLNDLLYKKTAMDRFVTLFWGYLEPRTALFRYVNAGHCPPVLFRSRTGGNELVRLDEGGPVLGALAGVGYRQGSVTVADGDLMVVYSDGIVEAANTIGEEFGEAGILSSVRNRWDGSASEIRDGILGDLAGFRDGASPHDDQTLVVVRFRPQPVGGAPEEHVPVGEAVSA
jgi:sigma-B regulation protein RsbU (phosphoserine phosphatase)